MSMDLTGIVNKNEYFTNHYFSTVFEENASATISGWNAEARESEESRTPWSLLRQNARQYYTAHDISFHKTSQSELSLAYNVELQAGLLDIMDEIAKLYGMDSFRDRVSIKTAVGSPGFIEMILPHIPVAVISVGAVAKIATPARQEKCLL